MIYLYLTTPISLEWRQFCPDEWPFWCDLVFGVSICILLLQSFFVVCLSGLGVRVILISWKLLEAFFSNNINSISVNSLKFWYNYAVNPSGPGLFRFGRLFRTISIPLLILDLLKLLIYLGLILVYFRHLELVNFLKIFFRLVKYKF